MQDMDSLIGSLKGLNLILEQENFFLENGNLQGVVNIYSEKERLTKELKNLTDILSSRKNSKELDSSKKNELNSAIASFEELKNINSYLLNTAIEKNNQLIEEIKNELFKLSSEDSNYCQSLKKNVEAYIINEKV